MQRDQEFGVSGAASLQQNQDSSPSTLIPDARSFSCPRLLGRKGTAPWNCKLKNPILHSVAGQVSKAGRAGQTGGRGFLGIRTDLVESPLPASSGPLPD